MKVVELLPHEGAAVLLDEVVAHGDDSLSARVSIGQDTRFREANGVPAHVGIEYMAQTCGAFSGAEALRAGREPRVGFILGTRRYLATRGWFAEGTSLVVTCDLVYRDREIGVFDCVIRDGDEVVATARLTLAEPDVATVTPPKQE